MVVMVATISSLDFLEEFQNLFLKNIIICLLDNVLDITSFMQEQQSGKTTTERHVCFKHDRKIHLLLNAVLQRQSFRCIVFERALTEIFMAMKFHYEDDKYQDRKQGRKLHFKCKLDKHFVICNDRQVKILRSILHYSALNHLI